MRRPGRTHFYHNATIGDGASAIPSSTLVRAYDTRTVDLAEAVQVLVVIAAQFLSETLSEPPQNPIPCPSLLA